jgi:hypothetical protein
MVSVTNFSYSAPSFYALSALSSPMQSRDFLCRLHLKDMLALDWQHQDTWLERDVQNDMARNCQLPIAMKAGITEWQALYQGRQMSLGWDWFLGIDGQVYAYQAVPPRSNMHSLDDTGYDHDAASLERSLWAIIAALPWQAEVVVATA